MSSMPSRVESVITAFHGQPCSQLESVVDSRVRGALSESQRKRLDTACSEVLRVYPDKKGRYKVQSPDEEGGYTTYTADMKYEGAKTCTCADYMYRCDPESGHMCKHLWRVKILINLGAIPSATKNPYDWLLDELYIDHQSMKSEQTEARNTQYSDAMSQLIDEVESTHRIAIDYPQVCTARANILKSSYTA